MDQDNGYRQVLRIERERRRRQRETRYKVSKQNIDAATRWRNAARAKQLPPALDHPLPDEQRDDWFIWFIGSGRGFGKTWTGANWTIELAAAYPGCVIALIGQTADDVRKTMIEINPSSIMKQSPPNFRPIYEPAKRMLTWPNGSIALIYYGDQPDQMRGPQPHFAWVDELAKFKYPNELWDMLEFAMRTGDQPRILVTTTPRPIAIIKQILKDPDTVHVTGSTFENEDNLAARYIARIRRKYEGTRLGRQELFGAILDDNPGALFKMKYIDPPYRVSEYPPLVRVVVAIDPAVTSEEDSDETGIVVGGVDERGHGYILADRSLRASPNEWASQAVAAYHAHRADRIIGESNNGGDMIETTIRAVDHNVSYSKVIASRGKITRAEPIAALYEQGRVHHVGSFPDLEDQMCSWMLGMSSPDRMDALVWCLSELMLDEGGEAFLMNLDGDDSAANGFNWSFGG